MQWILQDFEDTRRLAEVLERRGLRHSWHKVVPFVGDLEPEPEVVDPSDVVLFGAYTLWRYAARRGLGPGVFGLRPFSGEAAWAPFLLNGVGARFLTVRDIAEDLEIEARDWFVRPVDDSKAIAGQVMSAAALVTLARNVLAVPSEELVDGSLEHDTEMMLSAPVRILQEWRIWVVADRVVTYSLYREGRRVVYRPEIDADALAYAREVIAANPGYAPAYVLDLCRTAEGLRMLETNCINAAGFYAADLGVLVNAIEGLGR